jgi:hypothetical protein
MEMRFPDDNGGKEERERELFFRYLLLLMMRMYWTVMEIYYLGTCVALFINL